jgi:hypothetical protein
MQYKQRETVRKHLKKARKAKEKLAESKTAGKTK